MRRNNTKNRHIGGKCVENIPELAIEKGMRDVNAGIYPFNEQSRKMFVAVGLKQVENDHRYLRSNDI